MSKYIVLAIIFFLLMGFCLYIMKTKYHIEKGDCFDEENNKINELTCDVKIQDYPFLPILTSIFMMIAVVSFFIGIINWEMK